MLAEKQGVLAGRVFSDGLPSTDTDEMERAAEEIVDELEKHASDDRHDFTVTLLGIPVKVEYRPDDRSVAGATAYAGRLVTVHRRYDPDDRETMLYAMYHELLHITQFYTSNRKKMYIEEPWLRHDADATGNIDIKEADVTFTMKYMIYVTGTHERRAYCHQAYLHALRECRRGASPRDAVKTSVAGILKTGTMDPLEACVMRGAAEPNGIYRPFAMYVMNDLVNFFRELSSINIAQCNFDREIFRLPAVMRIRRKLKEMFPDRHENRPSGGNAAAIRAAAARAATAMCDGLPKETREEICRSFVSHLRYRYDRALRAFSKAASLAVDDWNELQKTKRQKRE